ncbi:MAG: hypothetical protein PQJ60_07935, partial [Spirochaetales bacterium]|nr:hypothetical protein [Spirochaetales bacterium]
LISLYLMMLASVACFAQSALWAGNAARGNDDAYPAAIRSAGKSAGMSLALPEGTVVQVKNQKNGLTADVTIVAGQGKPGIFLLLNSAAADALEIHSGEVIMVEIQEKSSSSNPFLDYSADPDSFKRNLTEEFLVPAQDDPDNAAALDVEEEMDKMGYETAEAEEEAVLSELDEEEGENEVVLAQEAPEEEEPLGEEEILPAELPEPEVVPTEEVAVLEEEIPSEEILMEEDLPVEVEPEVIPEDREPEPVREEIIIPEAEGDFEDVIIADKESSFDEVLDFRDEETILAETAVEPEPVVETVPEPEEEPEAVVEADEPFLADEISSEELVTTEESPSEPEPVVALAEGDPEPVVALAEDDVDAEEVSVEAEESAPVESPVDPNRVIYFLTPAELRPPEPVEEAPLLPQWEEGRDDVLTTSPEPDSELVEAGEPEEAETLAMAEDIPAEPEVKEPEILFVPQYVEAEELESFMKETVEAGSRYVQVASFDEGESDKIYQNMENLQDSFPYLPMLLMPGAEEKTLRLMVGPVSRDEVGILLYAMKARGFADVFMSRE